MTTVQLGAPQRMPRGEASTRRSAARQFSCIARRGFVLENGSPVEIRIRFSIRGFRGGSAPSARVRFSLIFLSEERFAGVCGQV